MNQKKSRNVNLPRKLRKSYLELPKQNIGSIQLGTKCLKAGDHMKLFNLYNDKKEPVAVVAKNINGTYTLKGMANTQIDYLYKKEIEYSEIQALKQSFDLRSEEELGQVTLDELLGGIS